MTALPLPRLEAIADALRRRCGVRAVAEAEAWSRTFHEMGLSDDAAVWRRVADLVALRQLERTPSARTEHLAALRASLELEPT